MRWRRGVRRSSGFSAFEGINITPFTDVLLVLLIIFMIAGSSLAPTGIRLHGLVVDEASNSSLSQPSSRLDVWISVEGNLRYESEGRTLEAAALTGFSRGVPVVLRAAPGTSVDRVVREFERISRLGFRQVSFGPPGEP